MGPRLQAEAARAEMLESGAYLTDGARLFRVIGNSPTMVELENCRVPDENPSWYAVGRVLERMRLVRPSPAKCEAEVALHP